MQDVDTANDNLNRAIATALQVHVVPRVQMVSVVRDLRGKLDVFVDHCRPSDRAFVLATYGVDLYNPLTSVEYACGWYDANAGGTITVRGSEALKPLVRKRFVELLEAARPRQTVGATN